MFRWLFLFVSVGAVCPWGATAQTGPTTLVVVESRGAERPSEAGDLGLRAEAQLRLRGVALVSLSEERRSSGQAAGQTYDDPAAALTELQRINGLSLRAIAIGDPEASTARLAEADALVLSDLDLITRPEAGPSAVIDACLLRARFQLSQSEEDAAREGLGACRRSVPTALPTTQIHPPNIRELLAAVDATFTAQSTGRLDVEADTEGCTVRVNGAAVGRTPARSLRLPHGDYRVQVECDGEAGAVHRVNISGEPTLLRVDASLQDAAYSQPCIGLHYRDSAVTSETARRHALSLARVAGASRVLIVHYDQAAGPAGLHLLAAATGHELGSGTLAAGANDVALGEALLELGDFVQPLTVAETSATQPVQDADVDDAPPSAARRITGFTLLGLGAAGLITGAITLAGVSDAGDDYAIAEPNDFDFGEREDLMNQAASFSLIASGVGGALGAVGTALIIPSNTDTPLWAWIAGGVGVAALGGGIGILAAAPSCTESAAPNRSERDDCASAASSQALGALLAGTGLPLLTAPLMYLLTGSGPDESAAQLHLHLGRDHAELTLQGHL